MDKTKLNLQGQFVFIWSAIDVKRYEALALKVSTTRGELDAILFLNHPCLVDHGPWYLPAPEHLGLRYKQVTFGERNPVEPWSKNW